MQQNLLLFVILKVLKEKDLSLNGENEIESSFLYTLSQKSFKSSLAP